MVFGEDHWSEVDEPMEGPASEVSFSESVPFPGLLHVLHKATEGLLTALPDVDQAVDGLMGAVQLDLYPDAFRKACLFASNHLTESS